MGQGFCLSRVSESLRSPIRSRRTLSPSILKRILSPATTLRRLLASMGIVTCPFSLTVETPTSILYIPYLMVGGCYYKVADFDAGFLIGLVDH